jgi:hypothetical protein
MAVVTQQSTDWEAAEPGVRRRILQAQGALMLMEVQFAAGAAGYVHDHVHEQISLRLGTFRVFAGRAPAHPRRRRIYLRPEQRSARRQSAGAGTLIDVFTPVREDLLRR